MTCPSDEELRELLDGQLDDRTIATVGAHVSTCPRCRSRGIAADGEGWGPGQLVGRYVLLRPIGRGAAGVVYEAADPMLGRKVAIKLLRTDLHFGTHQAELQARLLREAQALARLAHPNVVAIHDVGQTERGLFIAMERIYGETLGQWLRRPRAWQEALDVYLEAGRGLAAAHASGVIHRDFKPENVLIEENRRVCVTDFGVARVASEPASRRMTPWEAPDAGPASGSLTRTGATLGTPSYMAPEQFDGLGADARSDIFSYAVSVYAGLYGTRPFAARTLGGLREAMAEGRVEPAAPDSTVPPGVREVLLRGLRAAPEERPQRMEELLAQLTSEREKDGLARAERILKEADGFFRPNEKAQAVSTLAVSLLEGALGRATPPAAFSLGRPDLVFFGATEIRGARLVALMGALRPFRQLASFVLSREGYPAAKDGTLAIDADAWYPLAPLVQFAHRGAATFGQGGAFDLARIWSRLTLENHADVRALPLAQAIPAIGDRLARDYRVHGETLDRSPLRHLAVGVWTCDSSDPFVCATNRGFFTEVLRQLAPDMGLVHRDGPCRDTGGFECGYLIAPAGTGTAALGLA
jgi:tRNA A-37 threonylcarbamoyl transferase component Bud32